MKKNWYVVYTKINCELKVVSHLTKKKIESFCPMNDVPNNTGCKKKWITIPLFQSIVFVNISKSEIHFVKQTNEVFDFFYWLGAPAVISHEEIKNLKCFTNDYSDMRLEKIPVDQLGATQITMIPHAGNFIQNVSSKQTFVKMILPSLGYSIIASVELSMNNVFDLAADFKIRSVL